jgi:hypothetical protein
MNARDEVALIAVQARAMAEGYPPDCSVDIYCSWLTRAAEKITALLDETEPADEREALAPIRELVANLASRLNYVETHWTPDERSTPMSTADVIREFDRLAAGFRRQGPITDAVVDAARRSWAANAPTTTAGYDGMSPHRQELLTRRIRIALEAAEAKR